MKSYIAWCYCKKAIAITVADTPALQAAAARDVKRWLKQGYSVELLEHTQEGIPEWCSNKGRCKTGGEGVDKRMVVTFPERRKYFDSAAHYEAWKEDQKKCQQCEELANALDAALNTEGLMSARIILKKYRGES